MSQPPPWPKGAHDDYAAFVIEVHVRRDDGGAMRSASGLQDDADQAVAAEMGSSGGMEEGAWALLSEAARAEAMLQLLVKLSNDAEFKAKITDDPALSDDLIENLSKDTLEQMRRGLEALLPVMARESLQIVRDGLRDQNG